MTPPRIERLREGTTSYLTHGLWRSDTRKLPFWRSIPLRWLRSLVLTVRGMSEHQLPLRASALTFITVLSMVPTLAFAFAVAKGLGLYDRLVNETLRPAMDDAFGPVDEDGTGVREAIEQVIEIVDQAGVAGLGLVGLLTLIYAVLRLLGNFEASLNAIWEVDRARTLVRKLTDYLSMVIAAPLFALVAGSLRALGGMSSRVEGDSNAAVEGAGMEHEHEGWEHVVASGLDTVRYDLGLGGLLDQLLQLTPVLIMWVFFAAAFIVIPNTRVRFAPALAGGLVSSLLWNLVQEIHVKSQVGVASYNELYAGFAAFPLMLIWLFLSWLVVLVGAQFSYAYQNQRAFRRAALARTGSRAFVEAAALTALTRVAKAFEAGEPAHALGDLAEALELPEGSLETPFARLADAGLLAPGDEGDLRVYRLARPADRIRLSDVLFALRGEVGKLSFDRHVGDDGELLEGVAALERRISELPENRTLRDLLNGTAPESAEAEAEFPDEAPADADPEDA
ncbi:MAG: YhjD/YihY/BrkB family envelope integrity protein [Planctomycetota bacterium]|jgi:membrane protein